MRNLIRFILMLFVASATASLYTSCSEENDCSIAGRPMMYCTLYTLDPTTKAVMNDTLDSLTVTALGTDSIIINNQKKVHTLMLPLRYTGDSTILVFHYAYKLNPQLCDTVYIHQKNTTYFESMDCGYSMRQSIIAVRNSKLEMDSIYIRTKDTNTNGTENLKLFYRYRN